MSFPFEMTSGQPDPFGATFETMINNRRETLTIQWSENRAQISFRDRLLLVDIGEICDNTFSLIIDGRSYAVVVTGGNSLFHVWVNGIAFEVSLIEPRKFQHFSSGLVDTAGPVPVVAPMPGKVVKLLVSAGDSVRPGQGVAVIEAMKMQNELKAPKAGKVEKVNVVENQTVNAGDSLVIVH